MPANNEIYDQPGDIWWDERQPLHALRSCLNPARLEYFAAACAAEGLDPAGKVIIDVGCGGGLVAEEIARLGGTVIGVDPSAAAIATARAHAARGGLAIDYRAGTGERLPAGDACADVVCCLDVLEHVASPDAVIGEVARVLRPGGLFLFDTINRTWLSWLAVIWLGQEWAATAVMPPGLHDWPQFITPAELRRCLIRHGLRPRGLAGMAPRVSPLALARLARQLRTGRLSYAALGRRAPFRLTRGLSISYLGYATRPPAGPQGGNRPGWLGGPLDPDPGSGPDHGSGTGAAPGGTGAR